MDRELTNLVRRERSQLELDRLNERIAAWHEHRRAADSDARGRYIGRHKTQLETLESVLTTAAAAFGSDLAGGKDMPEGAFYDACREVDEAIVWLERFWSFYREKFDQRDDPRLSPLLRAADELVWSCYHEVMERATKRDPSLTHGPAPLAFIAPEYSPAALDSETRPKGELVLPGDYERWSEALRELVKTLPLPLLRLPPWCVESPWWLIYVGHEVGHHLLTDLELTVHVADGIAAAVTGTPGSSDKGVRQWRLWSEEIFADAVSVVLMGEWAVWATAEVEWSRAERMVQPKRDYPPPIVRLELIASLAKQHQLEGEWALRGLASAPAAAAYPDVKPYLDAVPAVVAFLSSALPRGLGTLEELCGFDRAGLHRDVKYWSAALWHAEPPRPQAELATARRVTAASLAAWAGLAATPGGAVATMARPGAAVASMTGVEAVGDNTGEIRLEESGGAERLSSALRLAANTKAVLARSGPPGTRSAFQPMGARPAAGKTLAELLRGSIQGR